MDKLFKAGDKVFAKIKGYPPWPAEVKEISGKKYSVKFYGTNQTGLVKPDDMLYYLKNKKRLLKNNKRKDYTDAVAEIEEAISKNNGFDGESYIDDINENDDIENTLKSKGRKRTISEMSSTSNRSEKSLRLENVSSSECQEMEISHDSNVENTNKENDDKDINSNDLEEHNIPDEPSEELIDKSIKIISTKQLENYIEYAKHVRSKESLFKSKAVDPRQDFINLVLPVVLPSNLIIGIKLHKSYPLPAFSNEYDRAIYDENCAQNALNLSEKLQNGNELDDTDFIKDIQMNEEEIIKQFDLEKFENTQKIINRLKLEGELIYIIQKIRSCLSLERADPIKAVNLLNQMLEKSFDELVLKKHIHMVETIRRLRCYVGNSKEWNMTQEMERNFETDAKKVREVAEQVYEKMKIVLNLVDSTNFWNAFVDKYNEFYRQCKDLKLSDQQIYVLCDEPHSRQAYMDYLNNHYYLMLDSV